MKKKTYKRMKNRLYREIVKSQHLQYRAEIAEEKAEKYQERFHKIGSNIETIELEPGNQVVMLKWELKPEVWGDYLKFGTCLIEKHNEKEIEQILKKEIIHNIAEGLIDNDIIQIIIREPSIIDPLDRYGTYGAKLYVVPWEQMGVKKTIEFRKLMGEGQISEQAGD